MLMIEFHPHGLGLGLGLGGCERVKLRVCDSYHITSSNKEDSSEFN